MEIRHTNEHYEAALDSATEASRESTPRYVFGLVIPNKRRDSVVGEVLANGLLRLPRMELPDCIDHSDPDKQDELESCIESQFGICGYILRRLWKGFNINTQIEGAEVDEIFLFDILDDQAALRKPLTWVSRDVACSSRCVPTSGDREDHDVRSVLKYAFEAINRERKEEERRRRWETIGWFEKVTSWSRDMLKGRNMMMEGKIRQRRLGPISLVMSCEVKMWREAEGKVRQDCDVMYIKASLPFVREAQRTLMIRNVIGNIVPEVIAIHETGELMIQRSVGNVTDEEWDQEGLIKTILRMQMLSMNRISELEAGGLRIVDSRWMESNVERILNHELLDESFPSLGDKSPDDGKKSTVNKLRSIVDKIKKGCREVTSLGLPRTIVHGDLQLHNVGSRLKEEGNMYRFFDWADSFIGNPLHDFQEFLSEIGDEHCSINYEDGVKQVYEHWKPCATLEEMKAVLPQINLMSGLVRLCHLTQQWDAYNESRNWRRADLTTILFDVMDVLEDIVETWL